LQQGLLQPLPALQALPAQPLVLQPMLAPQPDVVQPLLLQDDPAQVVPVQALPPHADWALHRLLLQSLVVQTLPTQEEAVQADPTQ
jgi:hypothetical protein